MFTSLVGEPGLFIFFFFLPCSEKYCSKTSMVAGGEVKRTNQETRQIVPEVRSVQRHRRRTVALRSGQNVNRKTTCFKLILLSRKMRRMLTLYSFRGYLFLTKAIRFIRLYWGLYTSRVVPFTFLTICVQ